MAPAMVDWVGVGCGITMSSAGLLFFLAARLIQRGYEQEQDRDQEDFDA